MAPRILSVLRSITAFNRPVVLPSTCAFWDGGYRKPANFNVVTGGLCFLFVQPDSRVGGGEEYAVGNGFARFPVIASAVQAGPNDT